MSESRPGDVTRLLQAWNGGSEKALDELVPLVYRELRGLAGAYLRRERREHTLQPTALVHEAYMRLVQDKEAPGQSHAQFFAITTERRIKHPAVVAVTEHAQLRLFA